MCCLYTNWKGFKEKLCMLNITLKSRSYTCTSSYRSSENNAKEGVWWWKPCAPWCTAGCLVCCGVLCVAAHLIKAYTHMGANMGASICKHCCYERLCTSLCSFMLDLHHRAAALPWVSTRNIIKAYMKPEQPKHWGRKLFTEEMLPQTCKMSSHWTHPGSSPCRACSTMKW